jgi:Kef-type K+ transport system membrane component KefB/K+/H+ antiporter YhaU regulatory subunit KhtT
MKLAPNITALSGILISGGMCGLVAKRLKLPMLIGYMIAGVLIGPHSPIGLPLIKDTENVQSLSELGILLLLFSLGLEFGLSRLKALGLIPWIIGLGESLGMWLLGRWLAAQMGFSGPESAFIGAMVAFSSTTVILKTFDELKLRKARFADTVLGMLLVEDIITICFIIMLSAQFGKVQSQSTPTILALLSLSLLIWWLVGSIVAPRLVSRARERGGDELLIVVSLGLCFGLAHLASLMEFSAALGAFVMGSILADTREKHTIENLVMPMKNIFVTVFFVSLGMLLKLEDMFIYWQPILIFSLLIIVGKFTLISVLSLLLGKNIQDAIRTGMSFTQIGEFAFVIAKLGMSLNVLPSQVLSIIAGTSTVTIFISPILMRISDPLSQKIDRKLPRSLKKLIKAYDSLLLSFSFKKVVSVSSSQPSRSKLFYWAGYAGKKLSQNYKLATQITTSSVLDRLAPWDEYLIEVAVDDDSVIVGQTLKELQIREKFNLNIVAIERRLRVFLAPSPDLKILPHDVLLLYGQEKDIIRFEEDLIQKRRESLVQHRSDSLRDCVLYSVEIQEGHPFVGFSLRELKVRDHYQAIVIATLREGHRIHNPSSLFTIQVGDQIFFVGHRNSIWRLRNVSSKSQKSNSPTSQEHEETKLE